MKVDALDRMMDGTGLSVTKLATNKVLVYRDAVPLIEKWRVGWNKNLDKPWYFEREFRSVTEAARWYSNLTPRKLEKEISEYQAI